MWCQFFFWPNIAGITNEWVAHLHNEEAFLFLKHSVWIPRPRGRKGGSSSEGQVTAKTRQHVKIGADRGNKDEKFHANMQEHSNTIEDLSKWDMLAAAPMHQKHFVERAGRRRRTEVAIGTNKPQWTHHHQVR